jgi:demethylmenaquinone methyltransferase/2-methoxy-6-polyprenyl-1,4-benzoquinol methylase
MFDRIAPVYDRMNTVMTLGLDAAWRRAAVRASGLRPGMAAVDVACGSGALTRELARAVGAAGTVIGIDVSPRMLRVARDRRPAPRAATPRYVQADALAPPLADGSMDAATIGFGLRNVPDYRRCLEEMARVTRVGGFIVVLEIATPRNRIGQALAAVWFRRVVPSIGRVVGAGSAYRYLPDSVRRYPPPEEVATIMREAGLAGVRWRRMGFGMVTLHTGRRV